QAAPSLPFDQAFWSKSKQFRVTGPQTRRLLPAAQNNSNEPQTVALNAPELAITCERIKNALLRELDATDQWRGRVYVSIRPFEAGNNDIVYASTLYQDGWHYRMSVPDVVESVKLVRGLVQVLLLEMANRESRGRCAEIPIWLREGFTELLLANQQRETLILESTPFKSEVAANLWKVEALVREQVRADTLARARAWLHEHQPFTFSHLNAPLEDHLRGGMWETYRYSAHLFLHELLRLPGGPRALQATVRQLPHYYNSQFALLNGFQSRFGSALDIEKWWSVTVINFAARDEQRRLPIDSGLKSLAAILLPSVEVATGTNALPQRAEMTLATMLERVDFDLQKAALRTILRQLEALQGNVTPELLNLIQDYRVALELYLHRREKLGGGKGVSVSARSIVRDTLQQLSLLDQLREDFKRLSATTASAETTQNPQ
ncbi:MAG: hypothetical protein AB1705_02995, partial [Verrucomicrobiota bacterium]